MNEELRLARAIASTGITELGMETELKPKTIWYRVDADYGKGWFFVGEANDRIGYLALSDRCWKYGAKNVRIYKCELLF